MARGAGYEERVEHFTLDLEKQISVFVMKVFSAKCVNVFYYKCTWGMVIQYWGGGWVNQSNWKGVMFFWCA